MRKEWTMRSGWIKTLIGLALTLPYLGCTGALTPIPGGPDPGKLNWKATDEFCRKEVRGGKMFLAVNVPRGRESGMHAFRAALDMKTLRNKRVTFLIRYRIQEVSEPPKPYVGSKFMVSYLANGVKQWPDAGLPQGSSDGWRTGARASETFSSTTMTAKDAKAGSISPRESAAPRIR